MLDLFFAMALSAAPLTLYLPPVRSLNLFVETMEFFVREITGLHAHRAALLLRIGFRRIISFLFQSSR
ncbi:hypothetical protein KSP40_PGU022676 [Platanthera guangdongensis]|uniref:Uncharacterized protein n=1 Tax=Platanthera guangdongensis TaxID=2320717 RepID=A0ABR2MDR7_9ASPA